MMGKGQYTIWRTKDGREIPLVDMGVGHLQRTIQVLRGKSPIGTTYRVSAVRRVMWIKAMAEELRRRGEPVPAVRALPFSTRFLPSGSNSSD